MSVRLVVKISCCGIIEKVKFVERRAGKNKLIYLFPFIFLAFKHSIFHRQGRESPQRFGYFLGHLKVSRYLENLGISRNIDFIVFSCQKQSSWYLYLIRRFVV